jgi:hypothetical protein
MHRTVGAVRHNCKLAGTQKYDSFINGCCIGRGLFLFYFNIFYLNILINVNIIFNAVYVINFVV